MPESYPVLSLKPKRERAVLRRHPWVFSGAIDHKPELPPGEIVAVRSATGDTLGYGHYHPRAPITCRLFHFGPAEAPFSESYWRAKLTAARRFRETLPALAHTDGYRLVNAEGDGLPGAVVDVYGDAAVLQLRTPGMSTLLPHFRDFLTEEMKLSAVYDKSGGPDTEGGGWLVPAGHPIQFREDGLVFRVDAVGGQKTGFFLDQRDSRRLVGQYAAGRHVLDVFAYAGAFSMHALRGGATSVRAVDSSAAAVSAARSHAAQNFPADERFSAEAADAFEALRNLPDGAHDLIILDPPAFSKHVSTVDRASRGYKDINLSALRKLPPGGLLFTFSCSQHISRDLFRKILFGAAVDAGRNVRVLHETGHPPDHPVSIYHPEGDYLKGLVVVVD